MLPSKSIPAAADKFSFLNCRRLPARLTTCETALLLGFQEHDVAVLVAGGMLTPLGRPVSNAPKYFAAVEVEACARNSDWLAKATRIVAKRWREKNSRRQPAQLRAA